MSFIKELWKFLRVRKKLWLLPIIIIMVSVVETTLLELLYYKMIYNN